MMDFVELSIEEVDRLSRSLAASVVDSGYRPDLVAYLARGGWLIGKSVAKELSCPILELSTHRSGDKFKAKNSRLLRAIPHAARKNLRTIEITKRLKQTDATHGKRLHITDRYNAPEQANAILLVDDSADTGVSLRAAVELLREAYPSADIKIAVFNVFREARRQVDIPISLYEDTLLCLPSSKDSRDYERFLIGYSRPERFESDVEKEAQSE